MTHPGYTYPPPEPTHVAILPDGREVPVCEVTRGSYGMIEGYAEWIPQPPDDSGWDGATTYREDSRTGIVTMDREAYNYTGEWIEVEIRDMKPGEYMLTYLPGQMMVGPLT